jgi:hypothetical protein
MSPLDDLESLQNLSWRIGDGLPSLTHLADSLNQPHLADLGTAICFAYQSNHPSICVPRQKTAMLLNIVSKMACHGLSCDETRQSYKGSCRTRQTLLLCCSAALLLCCSAALLLCCSAALLLCCSAAQALDTLVHVRCCFRKLVPQRTVLFQRLHPPPALLLHYSPYRKQHDASANPSQVTPLSATSSGFSPLRSQMLSPCFPSERSHGDTTFTGSISTKNPVVPSRCKS